MEINTSKVDLAIDLQDQRINTYIQFKMLHYEGFKKEIQALDLPGIICSKNIDDDVKPFLRKLLKYEKDHEYKYSKEKGYASVSAIRIEILLPRKLKLRSDQIKFAKKFMVQVNPQRYELPWIAYIINRGSATYMRFVISEREHTDNWEVSTYNRNYYNKSHEVIHKKGSPRLDADGNVIREYREFSSKVRIFTFSKFKSFDKFMVDLKQKFMIAMRNILGRVETRFTIKKKNAKKVWHFYNRKCVTELNHAKAYVEMITSKALAIQRAKVWDPGDLKSRPVPCAKEIISIFHKYKARFDKGEFHEDDVIYKIKYKKVDLDTLQKNLGKLLNELEFEMKKIVPTICKNDWTDQKYLSYQELMGSTWT